MSAEGVTPRPPREEVRRRLLDAAARVFAARGLDGAGLAEVAAAAGLTKGAIYSNFAGKDELIYALMDEQIATRETDAAAAFSSSADAPAGARRVGDVLTDATDLDPEWHRLFIEYWSRAQRDDVARERFAERRRHAREQLATLLAGEADRLGVAVRLSPDELALVLLALSNGLAIERGIDRDAVPDDLLGRILALLVDP